MKYRLLSILLILLAMSAGLLWWGHTHPRSVVTKKATIKTSASITKPQPQATLNKNQYSLDDPGSLWVVVNKKRPLKPLTYTPADLVDAGNGQFMRSEAATALTTMFTAAKAAGIALTPDSGYRSYQTQVTVYNREVQSYGQATADTESAKPGYSEHQTGWTIDIGTSGCHIDNCFANTAGGKWLRVNAYKYGFLLRYQSGKESITGYRYEPWHFRYIGAPLATELHNSNVTTLEEFFDLPAVGAP